MSSVALTLLIGSWVPLPASPTLMEALDSVEVTQSETGPSGFQITFNADRTGLLQMDFSMLLSKEVAIGNRVVLMVTMLGSLPKVLIDGFITHLDLSHSKSSGASSISVTGEDVSVKMNQHEDSAEFIGFGHEEIVNMILLKYMMYGVEPVVVPPLNSLAADPLERVEQQQNSTDRDFLNYLAGLHGYVFMVRPGLIPLTNIAYWGPPLELGLPQPALTVDMGNATNVESISFQYDGLAPTTFEGIVQDSETELDVPVATFISTRIPLSLEPAILFDGGMGRTQIFDATGMEYMDALFYAQGMTDRSTDAVITASGEVDSLRYGSIMTTPGLVGVRGCGLSFDGLYSVARVTHRIKRGEYHQQFSLARDGLVSNVPLVLT